MSVCLVRTFFSYSSLFTLLLLIVHSPPPFLLSFSLCYLLLHLLLPFLSSLLPSSPFLSFRELLQIKASEQFFLPQFLVADCALDQVCVCGDQYLWSCSCGGKKASCLVFSWGVLWPGCFLYVDDVPFLGLLFLLFLWGLVWGYRGSVQVFFSYISGRVSV